MEDTTTCRTCDAGDPTSVITSCDCEPGRLTYAVQHPDMSHALLIDTTDRRQPAALRAWAAFWVLRHHDVMLDPDEFSIALVDEDTPDDYCLFSDD
jgi:hypothetical protein